MLVPGCGRGHEAALPAELGFEVVAVDFSRPALAQARERLGMRRRLWHPVADSPPERMGRRRDGEWLGLWGR